MSGATDDTGGRPYRGVGVVVRFEARRCIHAATCVRSLPAVFDTSRRPWILVDAATVDEVVRVVERCPSGALTHERLDGGPAEVADVPTTVVRETGGPLHVRGDIAVDAGGTVRRVTRATLCACGRSENAPFCDGSHRRPPD